LIAILSLASLIAIVVFMRVESRRGDAVSLISLLTFYAFLGFAVGGSYLTLSRFEDPRYRLSPSAMLSGVALGLVSCLCLYIGSLVPMIKGSGSRRRQTPFFTALPM